jgi:peroxiredoxin
MKKMFWMAILLMASVLTIGAQEAAEDIDVKYAANLLKPGTVAPDFEIQNNDSVKGVKLSDYRGKYVVLEFWASWCPDCRKDMPEVKALYEQYGTKGVQFIGVSFDTDKTAWTSYIQKNQLAWIHTSELVKWKKGTKIDQDYKVEWIPTYYLIDPEGKVVLGTVQHEKIGARLAEVAGQGKLTAANEAGAKCCEGKNAVEGKKMDCCAATGK